MGCSDSHVGVKLEVAGLVSKGEVVLGQFGFGSVKRQLVAGQPALVAHYCCAVDSCTVDVVVNVTAEVDVVALVARLDLAALLAGRMFGRESRLLMSETNVSQS